MRDLNIETMNQNIENLMHQTNTTQAKLAEAIGMSQSNVSRALSNKEGQRFTIEQVFKIAQHFDVSIDFLLGNEKPTARIYSPRNIAKFLSDCISNGYANVIESPIEEEVFEVKYSNYDYPKTLHEKRIIKYPAIYFPNYWDVWDSLDEDDLHERLSEADQIGNETRNIPINDFIKKFLQIHNVYKKGELAEETYNLVVGDYLSRLKDK